MNPEKGQHVKCLLINNTVAEGIVEEWCNDYVRLQSITDKSIMIIHHPGRDIMLTKIVQQEISKDSPEELEEIKTELEQEFEKEYAKPSDDDLRVHNLAKLKILMTEQDKKIVAEKLKDHHIGNTKKVEYGYPGILKKPRSE